ncbi:Conserved_hypothetical protein [Hexamita inflata]|uniref:Uncharacterized protein n=1 Tax=Hexamita inflata TaxID=28002 RepID=A0AA86U0E9_9EUKA|nr:Conserved hypothetical protein [Hexamita inflata]
MQPIKQEQIITEKGNVQKIAKEMQQELLQTQNGTHPEYIMLLETLEQTRERLHKLAKIQHQLAVQHADNVFKFTESQIENDYQLGREDVKEKIFAKLRAKKRELKELLDKIQARGIQCADEMQVLNDVKVPNKKRDKKQVLTGPMNFKLSDSEARSDIAIIKSRAEEADQGK